MHSDCVYGVFVMICCHAHFCVSVCILVMCMPLHIEDFGSMLGSPLQMPVCQVVVGLVEVLYLLQLEVAPRKLNIVSLGILINSSVDELWNERRGESV